MIERRQKMNQNIEEINSSLAFEKLHQGALLVDIREWEEIEIFNFDVEEQLMIPMSEFGARFKEIPMEREIIVGCNSGNRSLQVAFFLKNQGYEKVFNLRGGINDWIQMNLPVAWDNPKINRPVTKEEIK